MTLYTIWYTSYIIKLLYYKSMHTESILSNNHNISMQTNAVTLKQKFYDLVQTYAW